MIARLTLVFAVFAPLSASPFVPFQPTLIPLPPASPSSHRSARSLLAMTAPSGARKARMIYTWNEARAKARAYGFSTQQEFVDYECAGTYQLPKNADEVWAEEWTSWDDFLGVRLGFDQARDIARTCLAGGHGVDSEEKYLELMRGKTIGDDELASRLPLRPDLYYKAEWVSWQDFLGL